jgi:hypothetical protein
MLPNITAFFKEGRFLRPAGKEKAGTCVPASWIGSCQ